MERVMSQESLLFVADDCLAQILRLLDAHSIQQLSHTSPRMKARLVNGIILESLRFINDTQMRRFPKFISSFSSLSELVLICPTYERRFLRFKQSDLYSLPKSLTKLHFSFIGAHSIWTEGFSILPGETFRSSNDVTSKDYRPIKLKEVIPNMRELRLGGEAPRLAVRLATFLPKSVNSFVVYGVKWYLPYSPPIVGLPQNLRNLRIESAIDIPEIALPPLETLVMTDFSIRSPFIRLPTNLTRLELLDARMRSWTYSDFGWLDSLVHLLSLTVPNEWVIPHLTNKSNLLKLDIQKDLQPNQIKLLPPNLESLSMNCILLSGCIHFDFWPPKLRSLLFRIEERQLDVIHERHAFWSEFPKSLTDLDVKTYESSSHPSRFSCIGLIELKELGWVFSNAPEVWDFKEAKNLISLRVDCVDFNETKNFRALLPDKLRHFSCCARVDKGFKWAPNEPIHLPTTLTHLETNICSGLGNDFMKSLPKGLLHLILTSKSKYEALINEEGLLALPPHLLTLAVTIAPNSDANIIFPKLPPHLTSLRLYRITTIQDSLMRFLPKNLKFLGLRHAQGITDAALPFLPRTLTWISIPKNHPITPEAFFELRLPHLQFFDFRKNPHFTRQKMRQLAPPLLGFKTKKITRDYETYSPDKWVTED